VRRTPHQKRTRTLSGWRSSLRSQDIRRIARGSRKNATIPSPTSGGLTIHPARPGAATASVTFVGGDEVVLGFGETYAYMWDEDPDSLAEEVRQVLTAVFAGHFQEVGMRNDARVRVLLDDGRVWRGGSIGLPVP
jgi:hypothetical protein